MPSSALLLVLSAWVSVAPAKIYVVYPDGSGDFPTIGEAISAAASGDVIELGDGEYIGSGNRDLDFRGKAITVRSQGRDPERCTIDCQGADLEPHRAFTFLRGEGSFSILEGVTITNAYETFGGAVTCLFSSPTIRNCIFRNNTAQNHRGGGILCYQEASPMVIDCEFLQNSATCGGAVSTCFGSSPAFLRCTFAGNRAELGGGVYM